MYRLEPWGDDWAQAAKICAAAYGAQGIRDVTPADFIPKPIDATANIAAFGDRYKGGG